ncbi:MAG: hypothetical protein ACPGJS_20215 [Flammeovirgaceae bacterium]
MEFKKQYKFQIEDEIWRVREIFEIKWRTGGKSYEYTIRSKSGLTRYLEVFKNLEGQLFIWWCGKARNERFLSIPITEDAVQISRFTFPQTISYQGMHYAFTQRDHGNSYSSHFESETVECLTYEAQESKAVLVIEVWNRDELEIYTGKQLQAAAITALKPSLLDRILVYF